MRDEIKKDGINVGMADTTVGSDGESTYTLKQKVENFLYHYKWHTIIGVFLAFVLVWVLISLFDDPAEDAFVGYIGEHSYSTYEQQDISETLSDAISFDINGDGRTLIDFHSMYYLTDEQIKEEAQMAEAKGEEYYFAYMENQKNYESFLGDINSRDAAIWLVSEQVYSQLDKSKLMPMEDIFGYLPESAVDEYALDCSKLDITNVAAKEVRFRSYLVMRVSRDYSFIMGNEEIIASLEKDMALFRKLAEYKK